MACGPSGSPQQRVDARVAALAAGGARGAGPHFFFVPPLAPEPRRTGDVDRSLSPAVAVCQPVAGGCTPLARFSTTEGTGGATVRLRGDVYRVDWDATRCLAGACTFAAGAQVRIDVTVANAVLGSIDTVVDPRRTLQIPFVIEKGAIALQPPSGGSSSIGPAGGSIATSDGAVALTVPPGALAAATTVTLAPATAFPATQGVASGVFSLGPDGTTFASPVSLALAYDPARVPAGDDEATLEAATALANGWSTVGGARVDPLAHVVRVPISHFSVWAALVPVASVAVAPAASSIVVGATVQLTATARDRAGGVLTSRVIAWGSSDPTIAAPDAHGLVAGSQAGAVTVTASSGAASGTASVAVTGPPPPPPPGTTPPPGGMFIGAGGLSFPRFASSAALLRDGMLLVAGGASNPAPAFSHTATADLYDPIAAEIAPTGSMAVPRAGHTATTLSSGAVLVVGGAGADTSAELYDPASRSFAATGAATAGRTGHTATLLASGKVLIVGGSDGSQALASAELFDPASGTFAATGGMATARLDHTATLLADGKVLVAGGENASGPLAEAEVYDPAAGTFAAAGPLASARTQHVAAALTSGKVLIAGGAANSTPLASAELYDPASGTFSATGSLAHARFLSAAFAFSDGTVLVTGGTGILGFRGLASLITTEVYDPVAGAFSAGPDLASPLAGHAATPLRNGQVAISGGASDGRVFRGLFLYGTWERARPVELGNVVQGRALDINDLGLITGVAALDTGIHAFGWSDPVSGLQDLGALLDDGIINFSDGDGINASGVICGRSSSGGSGGSIQAVRWVPGSGIEDLGTSGAGFSESYSVNANGWIVGRMAISTVSDQHGFLWKGPGQIVDLGTLSGAGTSMAFAVNEVGQVVGQSSTADGGTHAFVWESGAMRDLGVVGGFSTASSINARGDIVGSVSGPDGSQAFLSLAGGPPRIIGHDHGLRMASAARINDKGYIVGASPTNLAILRRPDGSMVVLSPLTVGSAAVSGMNNVDGVVGSAFKNGSQAPALWTVPMP